MSMKFSQLTFKIVVKSIHEVGARTEVDKAELLGSGLDQEVLVLDIPVQHPAVVAQQHGLEDLQVEQVSKETWWRK